MNKPVEVSCSHCFCEECFDTFLEKHPDKLACPVCRSSMNRRSKTPNESLLGYIHFVNDVNRELKTCFNHEGTKHFISIL